MKLKAHTHTRITHILDDIEYVYTEQTNNCIKLKISCIKLKPRLFPASHDDGEVLVERLT